MTGFVSIRQRAASLVLLGAFAGCLAQPDGENVVWVVIPEESTLEAIAESLYVHDVVRSARSFTWYARWGGYEHELQAGAYEFPLGLSLADVAARLRSGVAPLDTVFIPPGVTLDEAATIVERQVGVSASQFLSAAASPALVADLGARGETVEGYLSPGIHRVRQGDGAGRIVESLTTAFEANWTSEWQRRLDSLGWGRDEVVTLASIIEGEVRYDEERRVVSSVYHNRLSAGMRLQADPTVIYALGERRRLFNRDYDIQSPYNTYLIDGLPPHPINQPSTASIEAALYPEDTDYLYFVAGPDGRHHFSSTYEEHLIRIRELREESP